MALTLAAVSDTTLLHLYMFSTDPGKRARTVADARVNPDVGG
jgi:hypothetical protein